MLILLIGPKGGGKSHIGRLLEARSGVHFFHVEPHWMAYHEECARLGRERSIAEGIRRVRPAITEALQRHRHVCIETTGASREILDDLLSFGADHPLLLARIHAPLPVCLERIAARDQTHQIPMDEAGIRKVYELGAVLDLSFDLTLENTSLSDAQIVEAFAPYL